MHYITAYDATVFDYSLLTLPGFGLLLLVTAVKSFTKPTLAMQLVKSRAWMLVYSALFCFFAVVILMTGLPPALAGAANYLEAQHALEQAKTAEGKIEKFTHQGSKRDESFCIKDSCFSYAFHIDGLQDGLETRVTFADKKVLKVELAL